MAKISSLAPVVDDSAVLLILGSIPGVESLRQGQYYANRRNNFWPLLYLIFGSVYQAGESYENKLAFLQNRRIALWDVIKSCQREGSLDTGIRDEQPNDFAWLFARYPAIKTVLFNGGKAYETFRRKVGFETFPALHYLKMPSTSPANTKPLAEKLEEWKVLKGLVESS